MAYIERYTKSVDSGHELREEEVKKWKRKRGNEIFNDFLTKFPQSRQKSKNSSRCEKKNKNVQNHRTITNEASSTVNVRQAKTIYGIRLVRIVSCMHDGDTE